MKEAWPGLLGMEVSMKNDYRGYRGSRGSSFLKVIVTFFAIVAVSFGGALLWQNSEESLVGAANSGKDNPASLVSDASSDGEYSDINMDYDELLEVTAVSSSEIDAEAPPETSENPQEEQSADTTGGYAREIVEGAVPLSKSVEYSYFSDALFFGDSISTGIPLYMQTLVPNAAVIAAQGVSPGGALTSQCINLDGSRVTMLEAAKSKGERKKIYIMLGANALDYDENTVITGYASFLQAAKLQFPDAVIYVQSILPVTAGVNKVYPDERINNNRITEYNTAIRALARSEGVNYVDVAQAVVGADGMLPDEASPLDGMHLTPEYYIKWFDYLRCHTVAPKAAGPKK